MSNDTGAFIKTCGGALIRVHGTLKTLDHLSEFPFNYLYAPDRMEFWRLVITNCFDISIVLLHGLVKDEGTDVHGLMSFRNEICRAPWRRSDNLDLFQTDIA